jgi:trk system potassium uptake protein TrkH
VNLLQPFRRSSWFGERGERLLAANRIPSLAANVAGIAIGVVGVGIFVSGLIELAVGGPDTMVLLLYGLGAAVAGTALWWMTLVPSEIRIVDVFITVTMAWLAMTAVGAVPYLLTGHFDRIDDAVFEAISGFTTTGATVTADIEGTSRGLLFWRSTTQWIGGMGVIVLVVAVLPTIGSGGMSLLQAEAPGPTGERLTPRVRETARRLWAVYLGFTWILAFLYAIAGMSVYDAVSHSFTTVSTGGFSPYQASMGHFDSATIEWVCILAMLFAGGSFTLYYRAIRKNPKPLLRSTEFRVYLLIVAAICLWAFISSGWDGGQTAGFRDSLFTTVSFVTTTGYVTTEYGLWSETAQSLLLIALPIVRPVRVGNGILPDDVAGKVVGFILLAMVIFGGGSVLIAATGPDLITSFSASATSLGNVGPGLGELDHGGDFRAIPPLGRAIAMVQMLLGRLEIYPVILALSVVTLRAPHVLRRRPQRRT